LVYVLVPLTISNQEEREINEPGRSSLLTLCFLIYIFIDYIILSSDDEDETAVHIVPSLSPTTILPIYLLNHL
jgi:hypothetical protein